MPKAEHQEEKVACLLLLTGWSGVSAFPSSFGFSLLWCWDDGHGFPHFLERVLAVCRVSRMVCVLEQDVDEEGWVGRTLAVTLRGW
jgi:hypothetical protein